MRLIYPPPVWTAEQIEAFNVLMNAVQMYELYAGALARLGVNDATLIARRDELGNHIRNTLGPRFRNA